MSARLRESRFAGWSFGVWLLLRVLAGREGWR